MREALAGNQRELAELREELERTRHQLEEERKRPRRAAANAAADAIRAIGVASNPRARRGVSDELDSLYEELADGGNQPTISRAIFDRVASQFLGRGNYPEFRLRQHRVFDQAARHSLRRHFRLARMLASMGHRQTVVDNDFINAIHILENF
ncbi:unnamed protein product [Larinioides sclopetarius]|uniref:Uncharacterized protein n=1 Tax=Larinioides sclopetarius TaxID=280406 RepID=A0AAV2APH1_9ARAC